MFSTTLSSFNFAKYSLKDQLCNSRLTKHTQPKFKFHISMNNSNGDERFRGLFFQWAPNPLLLSTQKDKMSTFSCIKFYSSIPNIDLHWNWAKATTSICFIVSWRYSRIRRLNRHAIKNIFPSIDELINFIIPNSQRSPVQIIQL